jgi:hypothetical protein
MMATSFLRGLTAALVVVLTTAAAAASATIANMDDRAYVILIEGLATPEETLIIEPGQQKTVSDQGMMRIEGQNAFSTLRPENTYYIRDGMFTTKPTPPPAPEVPLQSLPDTSGFTSN